MWTYIGTDYNNDYVDFLAHHGILGMKWGVRRYQNPDGSLTEKGKQRYGVDRFDKLGASDRTELNTGWLYEYNRGAERYAKKHGPNAKSNRKKAIAGYIGTAAVGIGASAALDIVAAKRAKAGKSYMSNELRAALGIALGLSSGEAGNIISSRIYSDDTKLAVSKGREFVEKHRIDGKIPYSKLMEIGYANK